MASVDNLRNSIIAKLLSITNTDFLDALHKIVSTSHLESEKIKLSREQKLMLEMSESDIKSNKLISQDELDKQDLKWLREQ